MKHAVKALTLFIALTLIVIPFGGFNRSADAVGTYTVWFETFGGSEVAPQEVTEGEKAVKPADPTKEGKFFAGWYTTSEYTKKFSFDTPIKSDTYVYAKWSSTENDETLYLCVGLAEGGGTYSLEIGGEYGPDTYNDLESACNFTATRGCSVTASAKPANGYVFKGWYEGVRGESGFVEGDNGVPVSNKNTITFTMQDNVNLYAAFEKIYTVTYDTNGGSPVGPALVVAGNCAPKLETVKEGYAVWEWYKDKECTDRFYFSTPIVSDITIYAYWVNVLKGFTMSVDGTKKNSDGTYQVKTANMKPVFEKESSEVKITVTPLYTDSAYGTLLKDAPKKGVTYYFKVEMDDVKGVEGKPTLLYTAMTGNVSVTSKYADIKFIERIPSPGGKSAALFFEYKEYVTHTVKFETNGGSAVEPQTVVSGQTAVKPADPAKEGYVFAGWFKDAALKNAFDFTAAITADTTVYAKWDKKTTPAPTTPAPTTPAPTTPAPTTPAPTPAPVAVQKVEIKAAETDVYMKRSGGGFLQLEAVITPANASVKSVMWTSGSPNKASVDANTGLVTAVKKGKAEITVTVTDFYGKSVTAKCVVTVKKNTKPVKKVTLDVKKLTLKVGETYKPVVTIKPATAYEDVIKWKSSNKKIAKVAKDGTITAKKKGTCTITATAKSGKKATIKVKVKK